jgi:hypothetical protein
MNDNRRAELELMRRRMEAAKDNPADIERFFRALFMHPEDLQTHAMWEAADRRLSDLENGRPPPPADPPPVPPVGVRSRKSFPSHTAIQNHYDYSFDWPKGIVRARLDGRAWGRKANLFLYFTDIDTGAKRLISAFWTNGYCVGRNKGLSLRHDIEEGDVLELDIGSTRNGNLKLLAARKLSPSLSEEEERQFLERRDRILAAQGCPTGNA